MVSIHPPFDSFTFDCWLTNGFSYDVSRDFVLAIATIFRARLLYLDSRGEAKDTILRASANPLIQKS